MKDFLKVAGVAFVLAILGLFASAFLVMILVGMWHGHNAAIPTLGFVDAMFGVGLVVLLALVVSPATRD
ncbi:hypothetical protein AB0O76_04715 [Streptomyces sp. NPDC086554]|uniref:hypothetical protein n=1 Tax=Streptomyces sp. NPDC086554 TaxID=3154864 RepID=UPI0034407D53